MLAAKLFLDLHGAVELFVLRQAAERRVRLATIFTAVLAAAAGFAVSKYLARFDSLKAAAAADARVSFF